MLYDILLGGCLPHLLIRGADGDLLIGKEQILGEKMA